MNLLIGRTRMQRPRILAELLLSRFILIIFSIVFNNLHQKKGGFLTEFIAYRKRNGNIVNGNRQTEDRWIYKKGFREIQRYFKKSLISEDLTENKSRTIKRMYDRNSNITSNLKRDLVFSNMMYLCKNEFLSMESR